jgi:hypothetical protein
VTPLGIKHGPADSPKQAVKDSSGEYVRPECVMHCEDADPSQQARLVASLRIKHGPVEKQAMKDSSGECEQPQSVKSLLIAPASWSSATTPHQT